MVTIKQAQIGLYNQMKHTAGSGCDAPNPNFSHNQVDKIGYAYFLQVLWGIRPRQLTWDPLWARADVDDLWSTMLGALHSPFSPSKLELGFTERDTYPKSFLVLQLHDCFQR